MVSYEGSRSEAMGGSPARAREHYRRALQLSQGKRASVHVALAESVRVREQHLREFGEGMDAALAVDPEAAPSQRLSTVLSRCRARCWCWRSLRWPRGKGTGGRSNDVPSSSAKRGSRSGKRSRRSCFPSSRLSRSSADSAR